MKKIIYSLVIMIAAGSLFTSCIEQVEPLGIQDMRFAKAEYIRALKDLRAADAEYVRAQAAFELARARYKDAQTANLNADTEYQKLLNEYQQLLNEARQDTNDVISAETANKIDSIKKLMAERELTHQKNMVANQDSLANAQERLRVALRNIALASQSLTADEKEALENATKAYEIAFEKVAKQTVKVFKAQQAVHKAEIELATADKEIDEDTYQYVDALEYYKRKLLEAEASALLNGAALLAIGYNFDKPEDVSGIVIPEDLAEWKGQIDALADSLAILDYSKAATITEIANYYVANIHDGVAAFNNAVAEFGAENDLYTDATGVDPRDPSTWDNVPEALTQKEADTLALGEPIHDVEHFPGHMDTIIVFPDLLEKDFNDETNFENFSYLLDSYKVPSPVSKVEGLAGDIMIHKVKSPKNDTLRIQKANQSMKDFILGAAGDGDQAEVYEYTKDGKTEKLYANYGLKGALDVIKRVYETQKDDDKDTSKIGPTMRAAEQKWANDRAILKAGIRSYQTFADSLTAFQTAYAEAQPTALIGAMKTLYTELAKIDGATEVREGDSVAILNAVEAFAKAREEFFKDTKKYDEGKNPNYFYFKYREVAGNPVLDSVKYSEIATQTTHPKVAYQFNRSYQDVSKLASMTTGVGVEAERPRRAAIYLIVNQLFGVDKWTAFSSTSPMPLNMGTDLLSNAQVVYTLPGTTEYTFTADKKWSEATKLATTPTGWEPAALTKAKRELLGAVAKYNAVYNDYWNMSKPDEYDEVVADADLMDATLGWPKYMSTNKEADLKNALAQTFKSHLYVEKDKTKSNIGGMTTAADFDADAFKAFTKEEAPLVLYTGTSINKTNALVVVLEAVDPLAGGWEASMDVTASAIFNGNQTDFANMTYQQYRYWKANHSKAFQQDSKVIEDWIAAVETAFADDAAKEGVLDEDAYNKAKAAYDRVSTKSQAYEAYETVKKAFTGEDEDGNANEIVVIANDYDEFSDFFTKDDVSFELAAEDPIYEVYTGKWIKALGGKQLEIANTLFPKLPENMKAWQDELNSINDRKEHVETLQTAYDKAYKSAAKAKYDVEGSDLATVIENVQKQVVEDFAEVIAAYDEAVGTEGVKGNIQIYTEAIRDYDENIHVGQVHPAELALANAQKTLAIETERLNGYQNVLAYAKANLDKILEYIKSLDVNFVVVTDDDIKNNK